MFYNAYLACYQRPNYPGGYPSYYSNPIFHDNPVQPIRFRKDNDQTYPPTYNTDQ